MAENGTLEGSIDEAAQAIEALLNRPAPGGEPATPSGDDEEGIAAQIEAKNAPAAETPPNTGEEAPPGDTPDETPDEGESQEAAVAEPEPVVPAPKVETQQAAPVQPQPNSLAQIGQALTALQIQMAAEFPDIKTLDDLAKLAAEDPARYIRYDVQAKRLQQVQHYHGIASNEQRTAWMEQEQKKLTKVIPDIADPIKGPALKARLVEYATEKNYTPEQIQLASASDISMLHDAMMYRDGLRQKAAQEAKAAADLKKAQEKAKFAPAVQKPGVAQTAPSKSEEKVKELSLRFEKSGRVDDLAALLEHRGR